MYIGEYKSNSSTAARVVAIGALTTSLLLALSGHPALAFSTGGGLGGAHGISGSVSVGSTSKGGLGVGVGASVGGVSTPTSSSGGVSTGLGASIGGASTASVGTGASIGGSGGVNAGVGATVGGANTASVGTGASIGGAGGVNAGVGASVGGANTASVGTGASIGGGGGVNAGVGVSIGGGRGIRTGVGLGLGDPGIDVDVNIGIDNPPTPINRKTVPGIHYPTDQPVEDSEDTPSVGPTAPDRAVSYTGYNPYTNEQFAQDTGDDEADGESAKSHLHDRCLFRKCLRHHRRH